MKRLCGLQIKIVCEVKLVKIMKNHFKITKFEWKVLSSLKIKLIKTSGSSTRGGGLGGGQSPPPPILKS